MLPQPIQENVAHGAQQRWLNKPVLDARPLHAVEDESAWVRTGPGQMFFVPAAAGRAGKAVRLVCPTNTEVPNPVAGRAFNFARLRRRFDREDWSAHNRLSLWVYPTAPGWRTLCVFVMLWNEGRVKLPNHDDFREGIHVVNVTPGQWTQIVWEFPNLARQCITGIEIEYRLEGHEPGASETICLDFADFALQRVEPDHFEGWNVWPGHIALCHSGYEPHAPKVAIASDLSADEFAVLDASANRTVFTAAVKNAQTPLGRYQLLDFSSLTTPGTYRVQAGNVRTEPFAIADHAWESSIRKVVNFFYCERCGTYVPGMHDYCHGDLLVTRGNRRIVANGGWHDAGDLSQGLHNTASAVRAMFQLAQRVRAINPGLADRLIDEARWGLEWVLKTRFGDGYRLSWATMGMWTDGILGTADDASFEAQNTAYANYLASAAESTAARVLRDQEPLLAERSLAAAQEDWNCAAADGRLAAIGVSARPGLHEAPPVSADPRRCPVLLASFGVEASVDLYRLTGDYRHAQKAFELARTILASQQQTPTDWETPLCGFFYQGPDRARFLRFEHLAYDQLPLTALAALCDAFPEHEDWIAWYTGIVLHSEYLKTIAAMAEPFCLVPNSIYDLNESQEPSYRAQVQAGIRLSDAHYLRLFPVWFTYRGNLGMALSKAKALSAASIIRRDASLAQLARLQMEFVVGRNPFAQSLMYGEGYDYAPLYSCFSGQMVGALPVGVQTRDDRDVPYWPQNCCYNWKELWVHPAEKWLAVMADLAAPARIDGTAPDDAPVLTVNAISGQTQTAVPAGADRRFSFNLPAGPWQLRHGATRLDLNLLAGEHRQIDLHRCVDITMARDQTARDGEITIQVNARGRGRSRFELRCAHLTADQPSRELDLDPDQARGLSWRCRRSSPNQPWVAVVIPDGNVSARCELHGK